MMIHFDDVYKRFGLKRVLNGLTFSVAKGEIFFILGRSGTGKSVSLKHMVGLLSPDQGKIWIDDEEISSYSEEDFVHIRKKCGLVFQLPALVDSRSLYENLVMGIRHLSTDEKKKRISTTLHAVGLQSLEPVLFERFPPSLSYGEQKRLALARTLLPDPEILLYDEPTTGLDPVTAKHIHELIRSISKDFGKTSIVVSHDMRNALATADRLAVLDAGRVVDQGTPEEIRNSRVVMTMAFLEDLV
ncbi:MAG: ATP-binding cassette domain-containing protein [Bdellovibrionota bacterium]